MDQKNVKREHDAGDDREKKSWAIGKKAIYAEGRVRRGRQTQREVGSPPST